VGQVQYRPFGDPRFETGPALGQPSQHPDGGQGIVLEQRHGAFDQDIGCHQRPVHVHDEGYCGTLVRNVDCHLIEGSLGQ
jgi:hypothetical protein